MDSIIDNRIVKIILIGILTILIVFMLITFPNNKHINTNETNIVRV